MSGGLLAYVAEYAAELIERGDRVGHGAIRAAAMSVTDDPGHRQDLVDRILGQLQRSGGIYGHDVTVRLRRIT
jgi:hypothetical protein